MKQFACGDVVPGCDARFVCSDEEQLLAGVASHAAAIHGMTTVPDHIVDEVRRRIVTIG